MKQYMSIAPDGRVDALFDADDDAEAPQIEGFEVIEVLQPFVGGWPIAPNSGETLTWVGGLLAWRDDRTIENARADKTAEMSAACAAAILAGFTSSALGTEHLYPTKITDQTNLAGSLLDSMLICPPDWTTRFMCRDSGEVWARRLHTAAQIQQVGRECKATISGHLSHNDDLRAQIATATIEELGTIVW